MRAWREAPIYETADDDDPHEGLCEYEISRRTRICETVDMLASL